MKIEEVINAIFEKNIELTLKTKSPNDKIDIVVYMDYDFYTECKREFVNAGYCGTSYEFYESDSIFGYPVYRVLPRDNIHGNVRHARFRVVGF